MRKRKITKENKNIQVPYVDPDIDSYGFERTTLSLESSGYRVEKENGVLMVILPGQYFDKFSNYYDDVSKIINKCNFIGSWGVRISSKKEF